jgi:hypothetical protein
VVVPKEFSRHLPQHLHPQVSFIIRGVAQIHESY